MFADYRVVLVGSKGGVSSRELKVRSRCDLKGMAGAIEEDRKERGLRNGSTNAGSVYGGYSSEVVVTSFGCDLLHQETAKGAWYSGAHGPHGLQGSRLHVLRAQISLSSSRRLRFPR